MLRIIAITKPVHDPSGIAAVVALAAALYLIDKLMGRRAIRLVLAAVVLATVVFVAVHAHGAPGSP